VSDEPLLPARLPALVYESGGSPVIFDERPAFCVQSPVFKQDAATDRMDCDDEESSVDGTSYPSDETPPPPEPVREPPSRSQVTDAAASLQYGFTKKGVPRRKPGRKSKAEKASLPARMPPRGLPYPENYRQAFIERFIAKRRRQLENPTGPTYKYEVRRDFAVRRPRIGGRFISKEAMESFEQAEQ